MSHECECRSDKVQDSKKMSIFRVNLSMKKFLLITSALSFILISCASKRIPNAPIIYPHINPIESSNMGTLLNGLQIYNYNVESLNASYHKLFCANLDKEDCDENSQNIKSAEGFGNFDYSANPIVNNPLSIKNISGIKLQYTTRGVFGEKRNVSGLVFMPQISADKIKGIVLFFHPTLLSKYNVPSYNLTHPENTLLASLFAAQGYIVAAPDYIGMGDDMSVPHPYMMYPQANTDDGLSMLHALRTYLNDSKILQNTSINLFVTGYSEGGGYALWFSNYAQNDTRYIESLKDNEYTLKATVGSAGAYDLSGVILPWLYSDVNGRWFSNPYNTYSSILTSGLKPALLTNFLLSYTYYNKGKDYSEYFNPDFFDMQCTWSFDSSCMIYDKKYNLSQVFNVNADDFDIAMAVYKSASFKVANGGIYSVLTNNVAPLMNKDFTKDAEFKKSLAKSDIYNWQSKSPITLVYLKQDSIVSNLNAKTAYATLTKNHSTDVKYVELDNDILKSRTQSGWDEGVDHVNGFYYLLIPALATFEQYKL